MKEDTFRHNMRTATTIRVNETFAEIINSKSAEFGVSKKDFVESCIRLAVALRVDPGKVEMKTLNAIKRKLRPKTDFNAELKSINKSILESRSTYVSFVKQLEKNIADIDKSNYDMIAGEFKNLAVIETKNTAIIINLLLEILIDDDTVSSKLKQKYVKMLTSK